MRGSATLLALLLLLSPLGAAQDYGHEGTRSSSSSTTGDPHSEENSTEGADGNSTSSGNSTSDGPRGDGCPMPQGQPDNQTELDACKERYCRENHEDARRCGSEDEAPEGPRPPQGWERWCRDEARDDSQRERCRQALAHYESDGDDRWISFRVDAANATLLDYTVDGSPLLESIHLETGSGNLTVHRTGSVLRLGDEDSELVLHDAPTGLVRFKGDDGSITVTLVNGSHVDRSEDGRVARIQLPDGRVAHLRADNATWLDNRTVLMAGFGAILLPAADREGQGEGEGEETEHGERDEKVQEAIENRKVGAEITLRGQADARAGGNGSVEVLAYDDVEVAVLLPSGKFATPEAPIRIEVGAELDEGRTIVLNVNRSLLESADPGALVLRYFDLYDQPDGSILETEVVFRSASSLQDILDPSDDGGAPEYWVVEDANGIQVLASVPYWSVHAITVGSLARVTPSVMAGVAIGVAGSLVAAAVMLWPRKPEDE